MARRKRSAGERPYARTERVSELVREIVAEELQTIDDERLELVTITSVDVDNELSKGMVYFDAFDLAGRTDEEVAEALRSHRVRLQGAIGRQARMRRTPELVFRPDPAVRAGARVDEILAGLDTDPDPGDLDADDADPQDGPGRAGDGHEA